MSLWSWEASYHYLSGECQLKDREIFLVASWGVYFIMFYLHGWFFVLADWFGFLDKYSIRSGKKRQPSMKKQWDAIREATIDTFVIKPVLLYITYPYISEPYISFGTVPPMSKCIIDWLSMGFIFSTSLFVIHCALHKIKFLYKHVHKKHHSFYESVGFTSQYHHPVEALASALHVIWGILIIRPHFIVYLIFLSTTLIEIVDAHCGYEVPWHWIYPWSGVYPWGSGPRLHDYHHSHNIGTFGGGLVGIWDKICGTDKEFRAFEKHRMSNFQSKTHRS